MIVDIRFESEGWEEWLGDPEALTHRVVAAVQHVGDVGLPRDEIGVILGDDALLQRLNRMHRGFDKPTNVLSFPQATFLSHASGERLVGDVALAREIISREASQLREEKSRYFSLLLIHGVLHLYGYDHETQEEADIMEALEHRILAGLAFKAPKAFCSCANGEAL